MTSAYNYLKPADAPYMQLASLQFRNYLAPEIERLSILHVHQTKTFDEVGLPVRGGLYDPRLGPTEYSDRCETCHQYEVHCPGHCGHIRLDVPVFNPLLYKFTYALLKGSCVHCHRLTCRSSSAAAVLMQAQMRCFERGLPQLADTLEAVVKERVDSDKQDLDKSWLDAEVEKLIEQLLDEQQQLQNQQKREKQEKNGRDDGQEVEEDGDTRATRNACVLKRNLLQNFLRNSLFKRQQKCALCTNRNGVLRDDQGRAFLIDFSGAQRINSRATKKNPGGKRGGEPFDARDFLVSEGLRDLGFDPTTAGTGNLQFGELDDDGGEMEFEPDEKMGDKGDKLGTKQTGGLAAPPSSGTGANALADQLAAVKQGRCDKLAWRGAEVREHFRLLWRQDGALLRALFPMFREGEENGGCPLDGLFCELILVPPTRFRPIRMMMGERYENPQTVNMRRVLEANETLRAIALVNAGSNDTRLMDLIKQRVRGGSILEQLHNAYLHLQQKVNALFDEDLDRGDASKIPGVKQILEKKQGLFRMHMMGKRVNFACRSVITPDPYLDVDEIGIPDMFAKKLTFQEPINALNLAEMRTLVKRGADVYPGASTHISDKGHSVYLPADREQREAIAKRLQTRSDRQLRPAEKLLRHVKEGDWMVMNRQPSLHKPSIMGHRVRVLYGQRALRMNYAPCKAYNADFDGDEMNGHYVQSHIAQAEVGSLAAVGRNYLVPKDATPLLGLIQDHVVAGVLLTLRGRFLDRETFHGLLLSAFAQTSRRLRVPPPAMLKPRVMWSGKQLITAIVTNVLPADRPPISLTGKAKTPLACWKVRGYGAASQLMSESEIVFRQNELLVGVLDKEHFGATQFGLAHCVFELYGSEYGVQLLSCFSRLFTTYAQMHGFTLGVADILVQKSADKKRRALIKELRLVGPQVVRSAFNLNDETTTADEMDRVLANAYQHGQDSTDVKMLDYTMKQATGKLNDQITKACVPDGLIRLFPENALQMMIQSGAKGSMVNSIQISCLLGQIELEGKRMALTAAGRTLPLFRPYDPSPRAGGFIDQRFLTGIAPPELFFHTMAGREGLIDTAVKTSRSGYLQRCIIKHLEGVRVHYDSTCRDHDGSVIQFRYGEDGMDVCQSAYLSSDKALRVLRDNVRALEAVVRPKDKARDDEFGVERAEKLWRKLKRLEKRKRKADKKSGTGAERAGRRSRSSGFLLWCAQQPVGTEKKELVEGWLALDDAVRVEFEDAAVDSHNMPTMEEKLDGGRVLGALPESYLARFDKLVEEVEQDPETGGGGGKRLQRALYWKGMASRAAPGECVGLLAAQSIGEPSTQMTLNTFHFAGRGEMNVTLGIPRLREILMTNGRSIATPSAQIVVHPETPQNRVDRIVRQLERVHLKQVLRKVEVQERLVLQPTGAWNHYAVRLEILPAGRRLPAYRHVKAGAILRAVETKFARHLAVVMERKLAELVTFQTTQHRKLREGNIKAGVLDAQPETQRSMRTPAQLDDAAAMSSDDDEPAGAASSGGRRRERDAEAARLSNRHTDDNEYDEEEAEKRADGPDVQEPIDMVVEGEDDDEQDVTMRGDGDDDDDADDADNDLDGRQQDRGESTAEPGQKAPVLSAEERVKRVEGMSGLIHSYRFDRERSAWCEITYEFPVRENELKLDVNRVVKTEVERFAVAETPGVERCIVRDENDKDGRARRVLQTQGINLSALFVHSDVLDVNTLYSNHVDLILQTYGVEACAKAIAMEMKSVFEVYGITVSPRHLSLTADYMTFTGAVAPFNRTAMSTSSSPLQKMTFETTIAFMRDALIHGDDDHLEGPSSRLVVGGLMRGGTGAFDVLCAPAYVGEGSGLKKQKATTK